MSLFKKDPAGSESGGSTVQSVAISSIVGKSMTVTGDIVFSGKLKIDGKVNGNIKGEHFILGESGCVQGDIEALSSTCQGKIIGNIKSKELHIIKGCRIEGNVSAINLTVESGASLIGEVKVDEKDLRLVKKENHSTETDHSTAEAL